MFDAAPIVARLQGVLEALSQIPRRHKGISEPADFSDLEGRDRLDAICMVLIAAGEAFKVVDRKTAGELFARYPDIDWRGIMGVRDVIAHGYFGLDIDAIFNICQTEIPPLIDTVRRIIADLSEGDET